MVAEVHFSDDVIGAISAALPADTDPARMAFLPELLGTWADEDLPKILSWETRAQLREREKRLRTVGAKAQQLIDALDALDQLEFFQIAVEPQMRRDGTSLLKTDIAPAKQRRDSAIEWLVELEFVFSCTEESSKIKQSRPPDKAVRYYLIVRDLAAIYEMITGRPATRRVDWESGDAYGPFWNFLATIWPHIFENGDPEYPLRVWAKEMTRQKEASDAEIAAAIAKLARPLYDAERKAIESRFREASTFASNLEWRHPDLWRKLSRSQ